MAADHRVPFVLDATFGHQVKDYCTLVVGTPALQLEAPDLYTTLDCRQRPTKTLRTFAIASSKSEKTIAYVTTVRGLQVLSHNWVERRVH